jgi:hypothetical protein
MIHIDINYINKLSVRLVKFQRRGDYLYQFRCPYCGDSKKNPNKARGFFYRKEIDMIYKCHNCGIGRNVFNFLKDYDVELHKQYIVEKFKQNNDRTQPVYTFSKPKFTKKVELKIDNLDPIGSLPDNHEGKKYLVNRGITEYSDLHWTDNFHAYVDALLPNKYPNLGTEGRIIISFYTKDSKLTHLQGRSIDPSIYNQRYVTITVEENKPKIFGLNRIDFSRKIYIVEGPFDSLFIPNCAALGGGDCDVLSTVVPNDKSVIVMDNEPRNRDTINRMRKYISMNYTICIWPENLNEKDINEIFLSGMNTKKILDLINKNTFKGMGANLALSKWCKC